MYEASKNEVVTRLVMATVSLFLLSGIAASAQQMAPAAQTQDQHYEQIEKQLQRLTQQLGQTQQQLEEERTQIRALQEQLNTLHRASSATAIPSHGADAYNNLRQAVEQLKEESQVQQAEIRQHDQTKIETASKYPVKFSGLILFNTFLNDGGVDNVDLPAIAIPVVNGQSSGSAGATLRQTILGFSATGPKLAGARSSADVQIDFFGGLANSGYSSSAGVVRMRTADINLDWTNTSLTAGLQGPLISPLSPTSYATVGEPALAWSGNLWAWAPQISVGQRFQFAANDRINLQFGLYDPSAPAPASNSAYQRQASPSESSKRPALESRISYLRGADQRPMEIGVGGYFSPQRYSYSQTLDAWAATLDWQFPFTRYLALSGEFYRGNAIGDLGGGVFKDVVYIKDPASDTYVQGLNNVGGWSQLKVTPARNFEFNMAFGVDDGFASQLKYANPFTSNPQLAVDSYASLARNRTIFANAIYRPRAYLLFSAEYRTISSWQIYGAPNTANIFSLAGGYSF